MIKTYPYYIVNTPEEFDAAVIKLGGSSNKERLWNFPLIVGKDDIIFQCDAKDHPLKDFDDHGKIYTYELKTLDQ